MMVPGGHSGAEGGGPDGAVRGRGQLLGHRVRDEAQPQRRKVSTECGRLRWEVKQSYFLPLQLARKHLK